MRLILIPLLIGAGAVSFPSYAPAVGTGVVVDADTRADAGVVALPAEPVRGPEAAADPEAADGRSLAAVAVAELRPEVTRLSRPDALRLAFEAYYAFRLEQPERVRKPYFYFVDYGLSNRTPRGYVFDMERLELVEGPFTVAHGRGSSAARDGVPTRFSNVPGSAATSLGLYVAEETYAFSGTSGGRRYRSIGLRMDGVSGRFNSTARRRGVVVHGAPYVTAAAAGRSEGCPAMEERRAQRLIPLIADGGVVFLYSPNDDGWLQATAEALGARDRA